MSKEANRIIQRYYSGKDIYDYTTLTEAYNAAALDYFNSQMPAFLPSPGEDFNDIVFVRTAFFRNDDWDRFVLNKVTKWYKWAYIDKRQEPAPSERDREKLVEIPEQLLDELVYSGKFVNGSSDTDQETWSKWLMTFHRYPMTKSHIYSLFSDDSAPGYIYIIRAGLSSKYKIGWTEDKNIEKRKAGLQTGSPDPLIIVDFFPASSRKTEQTIHEIYRRNNVLGEWFELSDEAVSNLSSPEWRKQNNIY